MFMKNCTIYFLSAVGRKGIIYMFVCTENKEEIESRIVRVIKFCHFFRKSFFVGRKNCKGKEFACVA